MEEAPLKQVGRYDLLEVIGRGGAAVVYLARQTNLQRYVALKELAPFHAADQTFAQRFVEEGRLAGAMNHANIVTVHEFFETDAVPYIAMEYLPHGSLRQYVDMLSLAQIAGVLEGVLAGLSHGGAQGVVHRDLKPENLLVAVDGRVKIADFGVARAFNNAATRNVVTATGTTIGTPAYMSPEQALGEDLTVACDLYSLGVIAWELFAGHTPFGQTDTPVAVLYRHVHEEIPPVRAVAPDVDARIEQWIATMLAKDPQARFATADDAWYALEDIVLDLLGPRWRRDARVVIDDLPIVERAPLAPAPFTDTSPATPDPMPVPAPSRRAATPSSRVVAPTAGALATVAPSATPKPSYTTILRPARRHRDLRPGEVAASRGPWRRRLAISGLVLAMAGAATAGVLLAGSNGSVGPSRAQQHQAQSAVAGGERRLVAAAPRAVAADADAELARIVTGFAPRRERDVARLENAETVSTQVSDAETMQKDYDATAEQISGYADRTPRAKPLAATMRNVAGAYGELAAAVRDASSNRFADAKLAITAREKTLQRELDQL